MLKKTFSYIRYDEQSVNQQRAFKEKFEELEALVAKMLVAGRASALAQTKLEEAYMWVGKAIRDEQFNRDAAYNRETIEQEDRDPEAEPVKEEKPVKKPKKPKAK